MKRFLKITSLVLALILVLSVLAIGILVKTVSPNTLKPLLTAQVLKHTGRELVIEGDLAWSFFPYLGVKANHVILRNTAAFKDSVFAEINEVKLGVKFMPLLHARLESTGIVVSGLTLHLIKATNGVTNWQDLQGAPVQTSDLTDAPAVEAKNSHRSNDQPITTLSSGDKRVALTLDVSRLAIDDATIIWEDRQTKQTVRIGQALLHAEHISLGHPFPIMIAMNFTADKAVNSGQVTLSGMAKLDVEKQIYVLNEIELALKTKRNANNVAINLKGNIIADLTQQTLKVSHFSGSIANAALEGKLNITNLLTHPRMVGHLQVQPFNLKQLLVAVGLDKAGLQEAKDLSAEFDFTNVSSSVPIVQTMNVQGNVRVEQLIANHLQMDHVSVQARMQNGVLELTPIVAALYQGNLQAQAKLNLNTSVPQLAMQANLMHVQIEPLLQDLGSANQKLKIKGMGDVDVQITTAGLAPETMTKNLNGTARFSLQNGVVEGVDIGYYVDSAYALVQKTTTNAHDTGNTEFGTLTATATIHDGVIANNDLFLDSPRFDTKGRGTIDLLNQQINYQLQTVSKEAAQDKGKNVLNVYNLTIPLRITGGFASPNISLDTGDILKQVAKQQVQHLADKFKGKSVDQIKAQLPADAGKLLQNLLGQ